MKMIFYLEKSSLHWYARAAERTEFCQVTLPSGIWIRKIGYVLSIVACVYTTVLKCTCRIKHTLWLLGWLNFPV